MRPPKPTRKVVRIIVNVVLLPTAIPLGILRLFGIRVWRMRDHRIGHLAANTDLFLRRLQLGIIPGKKENHLLISSGQAGNQQLLTMFKRTIPIRKIPQSKAIRFITQIAANSSILSKAGLFTALPFDGSEYPEWSMGKPSLSFTPQEEEQGKKLLQQMKADTWFACFHARDSSYLNKEWNKGDSYHGFRNCSIDNFIPAMEYVAAQQGHALRMGSVVEKKIDLQHKRITDYATLHRSDFGDIYLTAKSKFFVGTTAGLVCVGYIFNVPIVMTNLIPVSTPPVGKSDLFLPKKIWSKKEQRYLTFKEMIQSEAFYYSREEDYTKAELIPVENTAQEILDAVQEMNERLNGTWKISKADEKLQQHFKSLFTTRPKEAGFPSRIGAKFLRENKGLLG